MDVEKFRKEGYAAIDSICDYYTNLASRPVKAQVEPGYLIEQLPEEAPDIGEPFEDISADFQSLIMPGTPQHLRGRVPTAHRSGITHWQHPKFFAYFPAMTNFESILGELYSASVSNPGFNVSTGVCWSISRSHSTLIPEWICSPACTELEQVVLDWMANILGLDNRFHTKSGVGGGVIMGSASESCLTAAIAARERALRRLASTASDEKPCAIVPGSDIPDTIREKYGQKLVVYGSTQTHSIGAKTALLLGLLFRALPVSKEDDYAFRGKTLQAAMERDIAAGLIPFFVVATVGTTSTGAVDCIAEIGEVLKSFPTAFLHVDAAWAGVAYALPECRVKLRLQELNLYADSFCTNCHKWGLTGFDCSLLFVRDRKDLTDALDVTPSFLRSKQGDEGSVIDYRNWQIALGRRFRSLKLWFVLRSYGVSGFKTHLSVGITQCTQLANRVKASANFEIVTPPSLALLVFRLRPSMDSTIGDAELNLLNQKLHIRLSGRHDVMLTQTMLHSEETEIFCIRIALGGRATTMEDVNAVWDVVEAEGRAVMDEA
ncbi:hypothetical protein P7C73_g271, partial [Tremellales sp. Uapishka_1]